MSENKGSNEINPLIRSNRGPETAKKDAYKTVKHFFNEEFEKYLLPDKSSYQTQSFRNKSYQNLLLKYLYIWRSQKHPYSNSQNRFFMINKLINWDSASKILMPKATPLNYQRIIQIECLEDARNANTYLCLNFKELYLPYFKDTIGHTAISLAFGVEKYDPSMAFSLIISVKSQPSLTMG